MNMIKIYCDLCEKALGENYYTAILEKNPRVLRIGGSSCEEERHFCCQCKESIFPKKKYGFVLREVGDDQVDIVRVEQKNDTPTTPEE